MALQMFIPPKPNFNPVAFFNHRTLMLADNEEFQTTHTFSKFFSSQIYKLVRRPLPDSSEFCWKYHHHKELSL